MKVNYGVCLTLRFRTSAQFGVRVFIKYGNCHIQHIVIYGFQTFRTLTFSYPGVSW